MSERRRITLPPDMETHLDMSRDQVLLRQIRNIFDAKYFTTDDEVRKAFFDAQEMVKQVTIPVAPTGHVAEDIYNIGSVLVVCDVPFSVLLTRKGNKYSLVLDSASMYYRDARKLLYPFDDSEDTQETDIL